jgi:hypothetical protein
MMSESLTIRALPRCSQLFPRLEIQKFQMLNPDPLFASRAKGSAPSPREPSWLSRHANRAGLLNTLSASGLPRILRKAIVTTRSSYVQASDAPSRCEKCGLGWRPAPARGAACPPFPRQGNVSGPELGAMFHFGTPAWRAVRSTMFPFSLRTADRCGAESPQALRRAAAIPATAYPDEPGRRAAMAPARPLDRAQTARPVPHREWRPKPVPKRGRPRPPLSPPEYRS